MNPRGPRRALLAAAVISLACGLGLAGCAGYQIWAPGAAGAQSRLIGGLEHQWHERPGAGRASRPVPLTVGKPFAVLRVPAFGRRWRFAIVEGTSLAQLAEGPGHVPGTQLPGRPGNFAVAAHDITAGNPFLHLGSLRDGDGVLVTTVNGTYRYRVLSTRVVRYTDAGVLDPVPGQPGRRPARPFITLITCTPVTLSFTPWRIVVTGVLTGTSPPARTGR